jgi:hypothetical protein
VAASGSAHAVAVRHALPLGAVSALHELGTIDMFDSGRRDRLLAVRAGAEGAGAVRLTAVLDLQLGGCGRTMSPSSTSGGARAGGSRRCRAGRCGSGCMPGSRKLHGFESRRKLVELDHEILS